MKDRPAACQPAYNFNIVGLYILRINLCQGILVSAYNYGIIIPPESEERLREILKQIFLSRKVGVRVGERIFYIKHLGVIYLFFTNLYNR